MDVNAAIANSAKSALARNFKPEFLFKRHFHLAKVKVTDQEASHFSGVQKSLLFTGIELCYLPQPLNTVNEWQGLRRCRVTGRTFSPRLP